MNSRRTLPDLRVGLPYRVGVPSYVYPADISSNVEALAPLVEDIEIVLFESSDQSNLPSAGTISHLRSIARQTGITYTVHFPIDKEIGSPAYAERSAFTDQVCAILSLTEPLAPFAYILHLEGIHPGDSPDRVSDWRRRVEPGLERIAAKIRDPGRICIETLSFPFELCEPFLERFGFSVCLDIGHIWLHFPDSWESIAWRVLPHTRVVHLHGVERGTDHLPLNVMSEETIAAFLSMLDHFNGVLTLEVFELQNARQTMEVFLKCRRTGTDRSF